MPYNALHDMMDDIDQRRRRWPGKKLRFSNRELQTSDRIPTDGCKFPVNILKIQIFSLKYLKTEISQPELDENFSTRKRFFNNIPTLPPTVTPMRSSNQLIWWRSRSRRR